MKALLSRGKRVKDDLQPRRGERKVRHVDGAYVEVMKVFQEDEAAVVMVPGREEGTWRKARVYHLTEQEVALRLRQWEVSGKLPSPYTKSVQGDLINALVNLGVNEAHVMFEVKGEMKRLMSMPHEDKRLTRIRDGRTDWERFIGKEKKTEKGKDWYGRFLWVATALRKVDPHTSSYPTGYKLAQMGCCLDVFRIGVSRKQVNGVFLRLNTHSTEPLNMLLSDPSLIPPVDFSQPALGPVEVPERVVKTA